MDECVLPGVRESAQFIASTASHVSIEEDGVHRAAEMLLPHLSAPSDHTHSPDPLEPTGLTDSELLEWIFLLDTLNFCFWSDTTTLYTVNYRGRNWTGYRSLCAALCRAKEDLHLPVHKPLFYSSITMDTMKKIFRSDSSEELPLLEERRTNLHQAASVLNKHFSGSVCELVSSAGHSAQRLMQLLVEHFNSFRDISTYRGRSVSFLKRAQIFPADVWDRFGGRGFGEFNDIHTLTMFADYRVPQSLLYMGVLTYDSELLRRLRAGDHLAAGGEKEAEIRGCSIWAIELIKEQMISLAREASLHCEQTDLSSVKIDYYLWNYAKTHASDMNSHPIHRTNTIFY